MELFLFKIITILTLIISEDNITDITNSLVLRFKTYYPKTKNMTINNTEYNSNDYIESLLFSYIYLELENEKDPNQILKTIIKTEITSFNLRDFNVNNYIFCNYNLSLSTTSKNTLIDDFLCLTEDIFKIYIDLSFTKYKSAIFRFDNSFCSEHLLCGEIGIDINSYRYIDKTSKDFISNMVRILNGTKQNFAFYFSNKKDEGIFIFGDMPHSIFKNEFNENDIISFYTDNYHFKIIMDTITFDGKEYYPNKIEKEDLYDYIDITISPVREGIEFCDFFFNILIKIYFSKYIEKNICKVEKDYGRTTVIFCYADKFGKEDIKQFPNIVFHKYKLNFNISFESEDLFYYRDNKYFFKIYTRYIEYKNFNFGRIFLKKYMTVFNADKKQIYFYNKKNTDNTDIDMPNENKSLYDKYNNIILIIFICGLIVFLIIGIFIGKYLFQKRRKHANELDDKYEYKTDNGNESLYNPKENDDK